MLDRKTIGLLEFDKIREKVAACAVSDRAKAEISSAVPTLDRYDAEYAASLTREADLTINKYQLNPIAGFDDVSDSLEKARVGSTLTMGELLRIARVLRSGRIARTTLQDTPEDIVLLKRIADAILIDFGLEKDINSAIVSDVEMSDNASEKLFGLRRKLLNLNAKLKDRLASYTRKNASSKYLQDNIVTVREGRYVLPVKAECRGEVQGIVHDRSSTGSTIFVEPFAIVELNNELRETVAEEQAEIERILADFSKRVASHAEAIYICQNVCTTLDVAFAKAKYSVKINGTPAVFTARETTLIAARHPLIDRNKVVPVDIAVGKDYDILLITGPNTGGKTVSLKIVGLFCIMAYFGLYLPCTEAKVGLYDGIYCDIGDEQSIENELSTFSSHISSLVKITSEMKRNSLVLLDEVGGGTDPNEGAALAIGIVKYISETGACAVVTTHYPALKEFAVTAKRVENASMQFNGETLAPTYKLIIGIPGTSNAIRIARRLGLSEEIIGYAENALDDQSVRFENVLRAAEDIRRKAEESLEESERLKRETLNEKAETEARRRKIEATEERIRNNAAAETKRLVSSATERANEIIDEMKDLMIEADEAALLKAKKLRNELEDLNYRLAAEQTTVDCAPIAEKDIIAGKTVIVRTLGGEGTVRSVNPKRKEAEVRVGSVITKVKFSDLGLPLVNKVAAKTEKKKAVTGERASSGFSEREIMLLGKTVDEAVSMLEPLIYSMANENDAKILRIVHGKGTGALGKGVQAYLKTNPLVAEYRYGRYGEGDNGVTIATIR